MEALLVAIGANEEEDVDEQQGDDDDGHEYDDEEEQLYDAAYLAGIEANSLSVRSRSNYDNYNVHFLKHLRAKYPQCVDVDGKMIASEHVLNVFYRYLGKKRQESGSAYGTLNGMKSAFLYLWRSVSPDVVVSVAWKEKFKGFFKGIKRLDASEKREGKRKVKEGKDPIPFQLYQWVCNKMLHSGETFAHAYACLTWNLMCRTNNTQDIAFCNLVACHDSLGVSFAVTKNDQEGINAHEIKHVYANPLMPAICPVTSLAMYFATDLTWATNDEPAMDDNAPPSLGTARFVFPQNSQTSRFSKILEKILNSEQGKAILLVYGILLHEIGAHSFRKGSTTYASQGTSGGVNMTSINIRGNWSMGNVKDRYVT